MKINFPSFIPIPYMSCNNPINSESQKESETKVMNNRNTKVERFNVNTNEWEEIEFPMLNTGDHFRMSYNGKRYVNEKDGNNVWFATGEPFEDKDGVWKVQTLY